MAEKDQEHLRIRLGAKLLKRIDAAREKSGRTRTDEIEVRLLESFNKLDIQEVAEIAVRETLLRVEERARERQEQAKRPVDFYEALMGTTKGESK